MKIGKPIKYIAVPPKEVLERVKKNVKKSADAQVKKLDSLKGTELLDELSGLHSQGVELVEPTDLSGSLRGRHNLYNHLDLTIKGAEKTVDILTTSQGFIRKLEALRGVFEQLKKRGVKVRIAAPMTPEMKKSAKPLAGVVEVRHTDIKGRFVVVDGKEIVFMVLDDAEVHPTYDIGIWINTPFFAQTVQVLFENAWKIMKVVKF